MTNFKQVSNEELIRKLESLVRLEKKTTAEIIDFIREVDRRKLYLERGHTSLFSYLTKDLGYTPASAQRRIDSARLLQALPEIKTDLAEGSLNLMQVSLVAQCLRQKQKEEPRAVTSVEVKRDLLEQIKNQDLESTQKILSQSLDLPVEVFERSKVQKDDSLRLEITLSKSQQQVILHAKEILSHVLPGAGWAEVFTHLAEELVKRKDPARERRPRQLAVTSKMEAAQGQVPGPSNPVAPMKQFPLFPPTVSKSERRSQRARPGLSESSRLPHLTRQRRAVPLPVRRAIFQKDRCCQWTDPRTKQICGSRFQLQIDHIQPLWAGGRNSPGNLQLLCSTHNRAKYRQESRIRRLSHE